MRLEGFLFFKKTFYDADLKEKYDDLITSKNGYVGIKWDSRVSNTTANFLGVISDLKSKETKCVSNPKAQHLVSFSLEDLLTRQRAISTGVCIWYDANAETLYLSRDTFGIIPFYYIQISNELIAFSTDLASLVRNPQVEKYVKINLQRLAIYGSVLAEATTPYITDTFYQNVRSVPPGHLVKLDFQNASSRAHTIISPSKWANLTRVEEFGEEFRSIFLKSIGQHLKHGSQVVASHLSGGMDSSSVSTAIKFLLPDQPLQTLYNKSNTLDTDENLYAVSVANEIGSVHHEIMQSEEDFRLLSTFIALAGQPSSTLISPSATASLMHFAKDLGCNTIFNGTGGDSIVGSGLEMMGMALDNGQWDLLKMLVRKRTPFYAHSYKYPSWARYSADKKYQIILNNLFFGKLSQLVFQGNWKEFFGLFREISSNFSPSYVYILSKALKSLVAKAKKGHFKPVSSILRDDLLELSKNNDQLKIEGLLETGYLPEQEQALQDIFNTHTIFANEHVFAISRHYNITNCSPFYDRDLFELCMAVPDIMKFGDGIGRAHFREAMTGLLSEKVRQRSTKTPVRSLGQQIVMRMYHQARTLLMDTAAVWQYVDRKKFEIQLAVLKNDKVPYEQKSSTLFLISRTISIAIWLEWYTGNK